MLRKQALVQKLWYFTAASIDKQLKTNSSIRLLMVNGLSLCRCKFMHQCQDLINRAKPNQKYKYQTSQSPNNVKPQTRSK